MSAADRVEAFLDRRAQMSGLDREDITSVADVDRGQAAEEIMLTLTTSDLQELVAIARDRDSLLDPEECGDEHDFDSVDLSAEAYTHPDGRRCVLTVKGRWLLEGFGLGRDAACSRSHR